MSSTTTQGAAPAVLAPSVAAARARLEAGAPFLVTRLRHVGDVLLSLPLVAALRRAFPAAELHYLAEEGAHAVLAAHPDIDVRWLAPRTASAMLRTAAALRARRYAAAIDLFCNARSALLVRATGAAVRVGERRRGRRHLYTMARALVPGRSAIEQHLDAARGLGLEPEPASRPVLHLRPHEREAGRATWALWASGCGVLVHLAASQPAKEWPLAHAVAFVRALAGRDIAVVLSTAPHRPEASAAVAAQVPACRVLPVLPLRQLFGVLAAADAVVSVDGAPVHAAVALGRPTLALFGPTDPRVWFPYARFGPYRVLHAGHDCSACDRHLCPKRTCMAALDPEAAASMAHRLLEAGDAS